MALSPKFSQLAINTKVNAQAALANTGLLNIYNGSQPASADSPITTQTLLVTLTLGNPAFGAGVSGVATANPITGGTAVAAGVPSWFRLFKADGVTVICDGSVGTAGCDLNLSTSPIVLGATVNISLFTMTEEPG